MRINASVQTQNICCLRIIPKCCQWGIKWDINTALVTPFCRSTMFWYLMVRCHVFFFFLRYQEQIKLAVQEVIVVICHNRLNEIKRFWKKEERTHVNRLTGGKLDTSIFIIWPLKGSRSSFKFITSYYKMTQTDKVKELSNVQMM